MTKESFNKILFLVIYWVLTAVFYVFFEGAIETFWAMFYSVKGFDYDLGRILLIVFIVAFLGAIALASFEVLFFGKMLKKKPFGYALIVKSLFYLASIFLLSSIGTIISYSLHLESPVFSSAVLNQFANYLSSPKIWVIMIYWGIAVSSGLFLLEVSEKFGPGVLVNFLLGKYHQPKEETRIFMFLDLKSSTEYAEKLGHLKYSRLIQDCFYDLTDVVIQHKARIYQYVGDEVVLTWRRDEGIKNNNCIKVFFAYEKALRDRVDYYSEKYHIHPEFKAGLNAGFVTVAEVGALKKELAYHGDAIITASRIRSECNTVKRRLLISADLLSIMENIDDDFKVESMGVCRLRGKQNVIGLFSVEEN